jgi:signal transduction histidine kinase
VGTFVSGQRAYLIAWVVTAGLYTTPALGFTTLLARRAGELDRPFWRQWLGALWSMYAVGVLVLTFALLQATPPVELTMAAALAPIALFSWALVTMARSREGGRHSLVDITEVLLVVVLVAAPLPLLFAERILTARHSWLATPAAVSAVLLIGAMAATVLILGRICDHRVAETLGVVLATVGAANCGLQVAQALSDFALPAAPLLVIQAINMALFLLLPHYVRTDAPAGLDRLAPEAQVRSGGITVTLLTFVLVPVLAFTTAEVAGQREWAIAYSAGALAVLLVLSTVRHLLTLRETKRLYASVERAADDRRILLAEVMRGIEEDRRQVATELHEQAVSSYAAFVAYVQATGASDGSPAAPTAEGLATASALVRADFARTAETLRQLMLSVRPLGSRATRHESLAAPIRAYVDNLYDDARGPDLTLSVDDELALSWTVETVALRIVQEALQNVRRHAGATHVEVAVDFVDDAVEVRIVDDGVGFDPTTIGESGIAVMRSFAALVRGEIRIDSPPGGGTSVVARLGLSTNGSH